MQCAKVDMFAIASRASERVGLLTISCGPPHCTSRNMQVCKSDSEEICFERKFFGVKEEIFGMLTPDFLWKIRDFLRKIVGNIP